MPRLEVLSIETPVHGRVIVQRGRNAAGGVLAGYHGYAESADVMLERLQSISGAAAWTLVAVQALNRFYRGRSQDVVAGWMTRQDREAAIADTIRYVDAALDTVLAAHSSDPAIVQVGFSQGVATAFRAAVRGRRRSAAVIAVGGDVPPELLADESARFPRVLLVRGEADDWYTQAKLDDDVASLRRRGAGITPRMVAGGHEWTAAVTDAASAFLNSGF